MDSYYDILGIRQSASLSEIKRAFRERAKRLHPDIAGESDTAEMRRLLDAYEVLSDRERRFQYDKIFRPSQSERKKSFDYRSFLMEHADEPEYRAKLIFFELLHFKEDDAIKIWQACGGINFPLEQFLDREDWMDCGFILAEELERHGFFYESFLIVVQLLLEERKNPYFRHFTVDVELFLKELVRLKLRRAVSDETWAECMRALLRLDFSAKEEARWLKSLGEILYKQGDKKGAFDAFSEAKNRDPKINISKKF